MGSKVANAVGVAQQYMPQEKEVYRARLQGVQQNWNVTADTNNIASKTAQALEALGVRIGDYALQKEKQDYEYANLYARQLFNQTTDEEKKKLSAMQLVTHYGSYKLGDNKYAAAIIDEMRGEYLNNQAYMSYLDWRKTQPPVASEVEEGKRLEEYMAQWHDKQIAENGNLITNYHAFMNGYNKKATEQRSQVANIYYENKEQKQKIVRATSLTSEITEIARGLGYQIKTPEEYQTAFAPVIEKFNSTIRWGSDPVGEIKLLQGFAQIIVEQTGSKDAVKAFCDLTLPDGRKIAEIISPSLYYDLANKTSEYLRNQEAIDMRKYFDEFTSSSALKADVEKMMGEDPEKYRRYAPYIDKEVNRLDHEEKMRAQALTRQKEAMYDMQTQASMADNVIDNIIRGNFTGTGATEEDLKKLGLSMEAVGKRLMDRMDSFSEADIALIMQQPIAKGIEKWFDQYLPTALASGKRMPAVEQALKIKRAAGDYSYIALGKHAGKIDKLQRYIEGYGEEKGWALFTESEARLRDPVVSKQLSDSYDGLSSYPTLNTYSLHTDNEVEVTLDAGHAPPQALSQIKEMSIDIASGGVDMETARAQATQDVMKQWVLWQDNAWMHRDMYQAVLKVATNALLDAYLGQLKYVGDNGEMTNKQLTFGKDGGGYYVRTIDNQGKVLTRYLPQVLNDLQYLKNEGKDKEIMENAHNSSDYESTFAERDRGWDS